MSIRLFQCIQVRTGPEVPKREGLDLGDPSCNVFRGPCQDMKTSKITTYPGRNVLLFILCVVRCLAFFHAISQLQAR